MSGPLPPARGVGLPAAAAVAFVALAPGPLRSPDGLETLGRLQHGELDLGWSPPLWALVAGVPGLWGAPVWAAWVVNVLAAAAVAWPLGRIGAAAGGVVGGRAAICCWVALAAATEHAAVIDARPLSWWVGASCAAASVAAAAGRGRWAAAFGWACAGTLIRPELVAAPIAVGAAAALAGARVPVAVGGLALALVPAGLLRGLGGGRGRWEGLWSDWAGVWTVADFSAWMGSFSAATPARQEVNAALEALEGSEDLPMGDPLSAMVQQMAGDDPWPADLAALGAGLGGALGALALGLGAVGALVLARERPRAALGAAVALAPLALIAALPMAWGQSTAAATVLWAAPGLLALGAAAVGALPGARGRRAGAAAWALPAALGAAVFIDTRWGPLREQPPAFLADRPSAGGARAWLGEHPPEGSVWCTFSQRSLAWEAGLRPSALPPLWADFSPGPTDRVMLSDADLQGEDGGRGLALLRSGAWVVEAAFEDPVDPADPLRPRGWVAILRPRGAGPG